MRRREFIAGLLLATTASAVRAQQTSKTHRIAIVSPSTPVAEMYELPENPGFRAFFEELRRLGYTEGQHLIVERYSGEGKTEAFPKLAHDVVGHSPDVIFAISSRLVLAFKSTTSSIPVVGFTADPVIDGIVPSLAHPGGNITGVSVDAGTEIWSKRLALLIEAVPRLSKVGFLASGAVLKLPSVVALWEAARVRGIALVAPPLEGPFDEAEYGRAFARMAQERADALIVGDQNEHYTNRRIIIELAEKMRLPTIYPLRQPVEDGGLMAYAIYSPALFRHAAGYIDQILKGAKAGEIPYYQATEFKLIINVKAAKALGLTIPPSLVLRADEVIE